MPTTSSPAMGEHAVLTLSDGSGDAILVGSPAWYAWLAAGNRAKVGEVLSRRAFALGLIGDFPHAVVQAQQALALLPADAIVPRGIAIYILGFNSLSLGHVAGAAGPLAAAHAALHGTNEALLSFGTNFGLARVYQFQGELRQAAALYRDVIQRTAGATHQLPALSPKQKHSGPGCGLRRATCPQQYCIAKSLPSETLSNIKSDSDTDSAGYTQQYLARSHV